jgi:hypothetical protein
MMTMWNFDAASIVLELLVLKQKKLHLKTAVACLHTRASQPLHTVSNDELRPPGLDKVGNTHDHEKALKFFIP